MTEEEQPREVPSVRFRWLDLAVLAAGFATELASATASACGNLTFVVNAHRNWQIDRDRAQDQDREGGPIFTD